MTELEAADLVAYLNRAGLLWAAEGQAEVWADALNDVDGGTAKQAVRELARSRTSDQRGITPGDIRAHVEKIRKQRLQGAPSPQPPGELEGDPVKEKRWTRLRAYAIGNGMTPKDADTYADQHMQVIRAELPTVPRKAIGNVGRAV